MADNQPSDLDRNISHALVGLVAGAVVSKKGGWPGFLIAALVGVLLHEAFDAPVAALIAEVIE